ncbi:MAG: pyridoxamine kinase [Lachnospira sp.]|nr:pyridoxamine kinase [Lachnospira sp.]
MTHNNQKKIAAINDFSGFGRCSLAVELPIISALKVQCCPIPTSIFSNHTGFPSFYFDDYTEHMNAYIHEWEKLNLEFNGICTGFLGSARQIEIVENFIHTFKKSNTVVIVDPVMGDYGKIYSTYTDETCSKMRTLVQQADIVTPNLTEACILADLEYHENWSRKDLEKLAEQISKMGPAKVVITGITQGQFVANYCYEKGREGYLIRTVKVGTQRSGTGDIFASIIAADAVNGVNFHESVRKASTFIKKCIMKSIELDIPLTDGVCFEELLTTLR